MKNSKHLDRSHLNELVFTTLDKLFLKWHVKQTNCDWSLDL